MIKSEKLLDCNSQNVSLDNLPDKVSVWIWSGNPTSEEVRRLSNLFPQPFFIVKVVDPIPPPVISIPKGLTDAEARQAYSYQAILRLAQEAYPTLPNIIIQESSESQASPKMVEETVRTALMLPDWQLCYLSRFLDRCDLVRDRVRVGDSTAFVATSKFANGIQANLFTVQGRNMILGNIPLLDGTYFTLQNSLTTQLRLDTQNDQLMARVSIPNLFEFNIAEGVGDADFIKLAECASVGSVSSETSENPGMGPALLFIFLVIMVLLLSWCFYQIGPDHDRPKLKN